MFMIRVGFFVIVKINLGQIVMIYMTKKGAKNC